MQLLAKYEKFLPMFIRRLLRIQEVGRVILKHLIGYLADQFAISRLARQGKEVDLSYYPTIWERLRVAAEDLGPTFIKLGQVLSTRPDVMPREFIFEFQKLQEHVRPFSSEESAEEVYRNLGARVEDIFTSFSRDPIASASIGQVHYAFLKSGEEVIVKVQRPGIRPKIEADISIMMRLAAFAEKRFESARTYNLLERVKEFGRFIREEMDYTTEARYCDTFRKNFEGNEEVFIPKIYWEYTNQKILVMEFVNGIKLRETSKFEAAGYSKLKLAKMIGRSYAKMILEDGFFHADPHPGNIFVLSENKFALIDFGMVGRLDKESKGYVAHYFLALVNQDAPGLTDILFKLYTIPKDVDKQALKRDVGRLMSKYHGVPLGQVNLGEIINELIEIELKYHIIVPGEFTLFDKTFITLDGIGKMLAPEFDLLDEALPFAQKFIQKQFSLEEAAPGLAKNALEIKDLIMNFPKQINKIIKDIEEGEIRVVTSQEKFPQEMQKLQNKVDKVANRLSMSILIVGLLLAATFFSLRGEVINILGISFPQIISWSLTILGIWLVISLIRNR